MDTTQPVSVDTCVVIDCNEWIRLKWLGSPIGLAFLSTLKRNPALRLAIPETLNEELDKHCTKIARELIEKLKDITVEIGTITGDSIAAGIVTLTEESIEVAIRQRQAGIASQTIYPTMTIEEVRRALSRVNAGTPPNAPKNQQMKDSLIWESCVSLAKNHQVFFVTSDNGFYADRQPKKGLAANLALEDVVKNEQLKVFSSLEDAMRSFAPDSSLDSNEAASIDSKDLIAAQAREAFDYSPVAADMQAEIGLRGVVPAYFRTEAAYTFAVSFAAFFYVNKDAEDSVRGEAAVSGECRLDTRQGTIEAFSSRTIDWRLRDPVKGEFRLHEILDLTGSFNSDIEPSNIKNT
ncbi:PIN domain-containing protein [Streptosporangium canum]|uniref:PIN domain-containing protein n=1 Tax=Streptosporangium canum TaxID=324952 RepID=UPI00339F4A5D